MNRYTLEAVIDDKNISFNKLFKTRDDALNYMFKYLDKHFIYNFDVKETYSVNNKHEIEYVSDFSNRFLISRVTL